MCTLILAVAMVGCSQDGERISELEQRVAALEEVGGGVSAPEAPLTGRSVQEAASANEVVNTPATPQTSVVEDFDLLASGNDLVLAANAELAGSVFLGVSDPEFGGTTVQGSSNEVEVRLFRAGLEDRSFVREFLRSLGFADSDVSEVVAGSAGEGFFLADSDAYSLRWTSDSETLSVTVTRR